VVMTTWRCQSCLLELVANAVACGHRCPARRNEWVDFAPVQDPGSADHE
jgi:hypothetical protein